MKNGNKNFGFSYINMLNMQNFVAFGLESLHQAQNPEIGRSVVHTTLHSTHIVKIPDLSSYLCVPTSGCKDGHVELAWRNLDVLSGSLSSSPPSSTSCSSSKATSSWATTSAFPFIPVPLNAHVLQSIVGFSVGSRMIFYYYSPNEMMIIYYDITRKRRSSNELFWSF